MQIRTDSMHILQERLIRIEKSFLLMNQRTVLNCIALSY